MEHSDAGSVRRVREASRAPVVLNAVTAPPATDAGVGRLAPELRTSLTPLFGLLEVFLHRWEGELSSAQLGLLRRMDREGRGILDRLDDLVERGGDHDTAAGSGSVASADRPAPVAALVPDPDAIGTPARVVLEDVVPDAVAALLQAHDDEQLLAPLVALVGACGGEVTPGTDPVATLKSLSDELVVPDGRELTLGPVLRALSAAALERASGELAAPRGSRSLGPVSTAPRECLVTFDLGDLAAVRSELGDTGARWLVSKLRRTLRSLLRAEDRAMRYPAGRFLVLLSNTSPQQAQQFARRLAWEWDSYLGRDLRVTTKVAEVRDGDVADSLRQVTSGAASQDV